MRQNSQLCDRPSQAQELFYLETLHKWLDRPKRMPDASAQLASNAKSCGFTPIVTIDHLQMTNIDQLVYTLAVLDLVQAQSSSTTCIVHQQAECHIAYMPSLPNACLVQRPCAEAHRLSSALTCCICFQSHGKHSCLRPNHRDLLWLKPDPSGAWHYTGPSKSDKEN